MHSNKAKKIVAVSMLTAGTVAAAGDISDGRLPSVTIAVGALAAATMLAALAEGAPEIAAGFAGIVLVGALLNSGVPAAKHLLVLLEKK